MDLAEDAAGLAVGTDGGSDTAQEAVFVAGLEVGDGADALEDLFEDALGVEEVEALVGGLAPASETIAGDGADEDLTLVGQLFGPGHVGAGALEDGDGAALASQVGGDGLQDAGPQRGAHDGLLAAHAGSRGAAAGGPPAPPAAGRARASPAWSAGR